MSTSKKVSRQISRFMRSPQSIGASLSTGIKKNASPRANPKINPVNYEPPYQAEDFNHGGQVPPQGTLALTYPYLTPK